MRVVPKDFSRGPKQTVTKLNLLIKAVKEGTLIPGVGLRIRETANGVLLTLDDKILLAAGLANSNQKGRAAGDGKQPFGGATERIDEPEQPAKEDPEKEQWDGSGGSNTGGVGGGGTGGVNNPTTSPLRFATLSVPLMTQDEEFAFEFQVIGGSTRNYTWSGSGQLPPGISFFPFQNTVFASLAGTPTELGIYNFTVTVSDGEETISSTFALTVVDDGTLRITAASGSIIPASGNWFLPFAPIAVTVRGGVGPFNIRQVGGGRTPIAFDKTSDTGGQVYSTTGGPNSLNISHSGSTGNSTWIEYLAKETLRHGSIPNNNNWPNRIDIRVTDALGQNANTSVTVNVSIDTAVMAVATYNGYTRWWLRTFLEANNIPILF